MPTVADVLARTLREAGVVRAFGLPGGEILDFVDALRRKDVGFLLTRHEAGAAFMADATGQLSGIPGVCVSTLGPGAVNMTLGVANAFLDRSPLVAITAAHATAAAPFATHQKLDLNAVYRPFTKLAITLDGEDTAAKVRQALAISLAPRRGPVHIALPSDVARTEDRVTRRPEPAAEAAPRPPAGVPAELDRIADALRAAERPAVILGFDLDPDRDVAAVRAFVDAIDVPVFVTPKAKGVLPEDHACFAGVCAGVSGDAVILECLHAADLLVGIGFDPVESDKLWHHTLRLVSVGPQSIAAGEFRPHAEAVGDVPDMLAALRQVRHTPFGWSPDAAGGVRRRLADRLRPTSAPQGVSGYELTRRLRGLFPREAICATDVGSVKLVTTQAWTTYAPRTFLESNGLSAMSYALPAAMAARLQWLDRPVLCTIGDGGLSMTAGELETCVRERLALVIVVYNDSSLSLIDVAQARRGLPTTGVRYGAVDFARVAEGFGAWGRRVTTLAELDDAVSAAMAVNGPAVVDVVVDPAEYHAHTRTFQDLSPGADLRPDPGLTV